MSRIKLLVVLAMSVIILAAPVPDNAAAQDQVYGSQIMSPQERSEYQTRMRNAGSDDERQQIRDQHHERMRERADKLGVELPDEPPVRGMGQGMGRGQGGGMGQGQGPQGGSRGGGRY